MVNDLECSIVGRGGGNGGGTGNVADERFRRGNGSEFPVKSNSPAILFGRRLVMDAVWTAKLFVDFVPSFRLRFDFFGRDDKD